MMQRTTNRSRQPATFVLVHGAWAGAWAWAVMRIADRLTAKGHRVYAPTLSGLGERSHLAACSINLTTHVNDIVNEIIYARSLRSMRHHAASHRGRSAAIAFTSGTIDSTLS
ncbi:MAG: alpha/beta fold hydrolase [Pyrinomonadaceae bacterium]